MAEDPNDCALPCESLYNGESSTPLPATEVDVWNEDSDTVVVVVAVTRSVAFEFELELEPNDNLGVLSSWKSLLPPNPARS